jgi:class 3 adenylate cyclase/putative methionine-R-sulfoxide reductase with GAF domain
MPSYKRPGKCFGCEMPMNRTTLQRLLGRREPIASVLGRLMRAIDPNLRVEDADGRLLVGTGSSSSENGGIEDENSAAKCKVMVDGNVLGYVRGPEVHSEVIADVLSWLAAKDAEMKQLGAEILNLYREVNLIHRFSENLATLLDVPSVARASIEQACQMVKTSFGGILLLNEASGRFEPVAVLPPGSSAISAIQADEGLMGSIAGRGNPEIVNDVPADPRRGDKDPAANSIICVPLKMKERVRGVLVVGSTEPATYTAGDLKLMTTLAIQTATAVENAILYKKALEAAKAEALQETLLEVEQQKRNAEAMLLNVLPEAVARELQQDGMVQPMYYEDVTVCFLDFVSFSKATQAMAAEEVVQELNKYFTAFDRLMERYGLEKLKTIGDSYMFVSGLPIRRPSNPIDAVLAAMEIVELVRSMGGWRIRIGLHTGPVIAGVVGIRKFAFDVWGETVNLASRMESCGEPNRVNISERTFTRVKDFVDVEPRGRVKTKEGHDLDMFFVQGVLDGLMVDRSNCPPPFFERRYRLYFRNGTPSFPKHLLSQPPVGAGADAIDHRANSL